MHPLEVYINAELQLSSQSHCDPPHPWMQPRAEWEKWRDRWIEDYGVLPHITPLLSWISLRGSD